MIIIEDNFIQYQLVKYDNYDFIFLFFYNKIIKITIHNIFFLLIKNC